MTNWIRTMGANFCNNDFVENITETILVCLDAPQSNYHRQIQIWCRELLYQNVDIDTLIQLEANLLYAPLDPQPPNFSRIRQKIIAGRKSTGKKCSQPKICRKEQNFGHRISAEFAKNPPPKIIAANFALYDFILQ